MSTYAEQLMFAQRIFRQHLYKNRYMVQAQGLSVDREQSEALLMEDIVATLTRLAQQESGQQALFQEGELCQ